MASKKMESSCRLDNTISKLNIHDEEMDTTVGDQPREFRQVPIKEYFKTNKYSERKPKSEDIDYHKSDGIRQPISIDKGTQTVTNTTGSIVNYINITKNVIINFPPGTDVSSVSVSIGNNNVTVIK